MALKFDCSNCPLGSCDPDNRICEQALLEGDYSDLEISAGEYKDSKDLSGTGETFNTSSRRFYIDRDITRSSLMPITKQIMKFNEEDNGYSIEDREPIVLYIACDGGDELAGNMLIDVIEQSLTPVYTVNMGGAYSMAFLIYIAGHKRYAFKNSEFMFHDGFMEVPANTISKQIDFIHFIEERNKRSKEFVLRHSTINDKYYDSKFKNDWYMFTDEAKKCGFVDFIIGEDVFMDEIGF